jgi:hypothetical protein
MNEYNDCEDVANKIRNVVHQILFITLIVPK